MNYIELLDLIEERKETTLTQNVRSIITDKHHYIKQIDWEEDTEPGQPVSHYDRSGLKWAWKSGLPDLTNETEEVKVKE
jgi:hypothetical protein